MSSNSVTTPKLVFVHIPKTAGMSICRVIPDGKLYVPHVRIADMSAEQLENVVTFCVVRNPFGRLVSAFYFLRRQTPKSPYWRVDEDIRGFVMSCKRISDFITRAKDAAWEHRLFRPMYTWVVRDGQLAVDHVLRFETLKTEWEEFSAQFKLPSRLPCINRSLHLPWQQYFTDPSVVQRVADIYRRDVTMFNYPDGP